MQRAILALAQPAEVQLSLFPDFVCKADELALDFEDGLYELVGHEHEVTAEQRGAIDALDAVLVSMSGPTGFWTEEALRTHPTWERIRELAKAVAVAFGWELRIPPPSNAFYVVAGPDKRPAGDWVALVRRHIEKLFGRK
ncbi:hypothetical protein [Sphingomonas sp. CBMAI 2297]|uniref:hypothetical protein n=1 Tax=Sphingomonas sp. CBMAI 2297 TaxID=2991720 RepID=UPI0024572ACC|nr:hypothetical protein [Sphingomonas sp. CBMAI 2297]